jgi:hypothetical protein
MLAAMRRLRSLPLSARHWFEKIVAGWVTRRAQTRSTLTTPNRGSGSLLTSKTKPCGQLGSDRSSVTILADTGTQRSISTGISAGQLPRHVRARPYSWACIAALSFSRSILLPCFQRDDSSSRRRPSIGSNVQRAGSSSLPRPYCHFELRRGLTLNIAHSSVSCSESPSAQTGMEPISSDSAERNSVSLV